MSDLQLFEDEVLAIADDHDDKGIDAQSMPSIETPAVLHAQLEPEPMPVMQILPADFRLPVLTRFVPDPALRERVEKALTYSKSIEIEGKGPEALANADMALAELNAAIAAWERPFDEPASIAFELHRHVTGSRAATSNPAKAEVKAIGHRIWRENERLKAEAEAERRRLQDEANRKAREEAALELKKAEAAKAPAPIVEKLQERAKTAVAPPVAPQAATAPPAMSENTVVTVLKAKMVNTPDEADDFHRDLTKLSAEELANVDQLLTAILGGRRDLLALLSLEWGALDKLAAAQENTFNVPGFKVVKTGGTRKKPTRGSRSR